MLFWTLRVTALLELGSVAKSNWHRLDGVLVEGHCPKELADSCIAARTGDFFCIQSTKLLNVGGWSRPNKVSIFVILRRGRTDSFGVGGRKLFWISIALLTLWRARASMTLLSYLPGALRYKYSLLWFVGPASFRLKVRGLGCWHSLIRRPPSIATPHYLQRLFCCS